MRRVKKEKTLSLAQTKTTTTTNLHKVYLCFDFLVFLQI